MKSGIITAIILPSDNADAAEAAGDAANDNYNADADVDDAADAAALLFLLILRGNWDGYYHWLIFSLFAYD